TLMELLQISVNHYHRDSALYAQLANSFTMLGPHGRAPSQLDFHKYRGCFTPEFYPRRFVLKDCMYEQRLDVLDTLLCYSLARYALANVSYVEYSVGINDLTRPWV